MGSGVMRMRIASFGEGIRMFTANVSFLIDLRQPSDPGKIDVRQPDDSGKDQTGVHSRELARRMGRIAPPLGFDVRAQERLLMNKTSLTMALAAATLA
ncbi:MAG: hypothetical protein JSR49_11560, partial [Proteobacteria bacterium]|nr:hypothetical protein [Pseudomonadota bacterium]